MRNVAIFVVISLVSGIGIAVGCGNGTATSTMGAGGTSTSSSHASSSHAATSSSSTSGASSGAGGAGGGSGAGGMAANPFECTVPAMAPSKGSCVAFQPGDGGGELDAGVDDAGNASTTNCNPITNAGCTGTDVCGPDAMNKNYFCQAAGTPAGLKACGDCSAPAATCGAGALCVGISMTQFVCAQMCCTAADCGSGKCDTKQLVTALPSGVGLCIP